MPGESTQLLVRSPGRHRGGGISQGHRDRRRGGEERRGPQVPVCLAEGQLPVPEGTKNDNNYTHTTPQCVSKIMIIFCTQCFHPVSKARLVLMRNLDMGIRPKELSQDDDNNEACTTVRYNTKGRVIACSNRETGSRGGVCVT